ncbi:MAG: hypothetical protein V3R65_01700 [Acidiferrobacterales bacterium]
MALKFSCKPGRCERHLQRKFNNPLFPEEKRVVSQDQVEAAYALDKEEFQHFSDDYQTILQEIADLAENVDSEVVLKLKQRLDQLYEQVCGLGGDRTAEKKGLTKLHQAVNQAITTGAAGDPTAEEKLAQEAQARNVHWQLLEEPLVADLLRPDSPISQDDLLPSLLSEGAGSFGVAMGMFDSAQRRSLLTQAETLLQGREEEPGLENARARVEFLQGLVASAEYSN